jgi:hypothetical protein
MGDLEVGIAEATAARLYPRRVDADREWATRRNRAVVAHAARGMWKWRRSRKLVF